MRIALSILLLATALLFAGVAVAQNKVVVIPLWKTDPNVLPENICSGVTIQGVTGTMTCVPPDAVVSVTGRIWMDRNLGASRVATSVGDTEAFGDLYQWGRLTDGHEKRINSATTDILSTTDVPGHSSFIIPSLQPYDWRDPQKDGLWQGASGINNPCPPGFRLPTATEWATEIASWCSQDAAGAFASPLKLVMAGIRSFNNGLLDGTGSIGYYWSSTVDNTYSRALSISGLAGTGSHPRTQGFSVRCIQD